MKEAELQRRIRKRLTEEFGGKWVKIHGNRFQSAGLPDIVGCLHGQFYGMEVKQPGKGPTPIQAVFLEELTAQGAVAGIVHSIDEAVALVKNHIDSKQEELIR